MYALVKPLLFRLDPEVAHRLVFGLTEGAGGLASSAMAVLTSRPSELLRTSIAGLPVQGPVGLAAGLDKNGSLARFWPTVGFGFTELGTVTAIPQPGNPKPRLFRFPSQGALVNRMGFNNDGAEALGRRLRAWRSEGWKPGQPIGVNLGKSKVTPLDEAVEDYRKSTAWVADVADYRQVVCDKDQCETQFLLQILQQVDDLGLDGYIQRADRLVTDDEFRLQG